MPRLSLIEIIVGKEKEEWLKFFFFLNLIEKRKNSWYNSFKCLERIDIMLDEIRTNEYKNVSDNTIDVLQNNFPSCFTKEGKFDLLKFKKKKNFNHSSFSFPTIISIRDRLGIF